MEGAIYRPFFYAHHSQDCVLLPGRTGDLTHNIEGIDEEFQEF
jgi:hypothetical protein